MKIFKFLVFMLALVSYLPVQAAVYDITDLGVQGDYNSRAYDINNSTQIGGLLKHLDGTYNAMYWENGSGLQTMNTL